MGSGHVHEQVVVKAAAGSGALRFTAQIAEKSKCLFPEARGGIGLADEPLAPRFFVRPGGVTAEIAEIAEKSKFLFPEALGIRPLGRERRAGLT